ncbi:hypothetical protein Tco_0875139 [Tanacetum coccineum]|uniref:Uncharacterized protein n=1 Tax=Tanacetum coccineum TaxID=301880 RepID=A0ABQ5BPF3_9ASTR
MEPEVPLKKKDQVALDEEMARNLEAQLKAELIEEERLARQKEEEDNKNGMGSESDMSKKQKIGCCHIEVEKDIKRYSSMIKMLQGINREDLETLWKLVKAKHKNTRPADDYERVLWGDLKVMFEPDIKSDVWRNLQGYKVTIWKLFDNCVVHFVRFRNLHIFMLVEKIYPLTPITITNMLNKKLQADHWNEMCYQLLKLMTKQEKGQ